MKLKFGRWEGTPVARTPTSDLEWLAPANTSLAADVTAAVLGELHDRFRAVLVRYALEGLLAPLPPGCRPGATIGSAAAGVAEGERGASAPSVSSHLGDECE